MLIKLIQSVSFQQNKHQVINIVDKNVNNLKLHKDIGENYGKYNDNMVKGS